MSGTDFHIEVHDCVARLSDAWPDADDDSGSALFVFQSKSFLRAWEASYGIAHKAQLCLVEVRDQNRQPILFVPLCILRRYGARILYFVDDGVSDYNAPVIFPNTPRWTKAETKYLLRRIFAALPPFDIAHFEKMPQLIEGKANPFWDIANKDSTASAHWITLDRPIEEIGASIRRFKGIRKRAKALRHAGRFRFFVTRSEDERSTVLEAMFRQKQRRFEETKVPGFDAHPEKRRFFEIASEPLAQKNALHLSALSVDGEIIATMWSVTRNGHYCAMVPSFEDGIWSRYSPGKVLIHTLIQSLKSDSYSCLDLGFGNEPWKADFADHSIHLRDYIRPVSLRGRVSLMAQGSVEQLRSTWLYQKLRPLKWKLLRKLSR
ncbi:GNAT family N-acetyltransferase [Ochrobactrum sp. CM-21-5]|nr:GNAT family N-acetyltransferase [Ochrobactrum sp. CM-21-5]MBC2884413.1 GNAT family N-acetyltransferase [Ochrobactrum sp. CM-21-5]